MNDTTQKLLQKADRAINAGTNALAGGHIETAAGRAYYAMFYVAEALLNERGLQFRKHGGVHAAFGQHFAKTGVLDAKYHRWLLASFNKRIAADYGIDMDVNAEETGEMLVQAREFLDTTTAFLGSD